MDRLLAGELLGSACLSNVRFTGICVHAWLFYMGAGDSNSDLYACMARALTTAPLPQFTSPAVFKGASICSRVSFDFASISELCLLLLIISYSLQF